MDKKTEDLIPKCFYCHTPLIWQSDEMAQGLYEDAGADDLIQFYNCPHCNAYYENCFKKAHGFSRGMN